MIRRQFVYQAPNAIVALRRMDLSNQGKYCF